MLVYATRQEEYVRMSRVLVNTCVHTDVYTYVYDICIYMYIRTYVYMCIYTYIQICNGKGDFAQVRVI